MHISSQEQGNKSAAGQVGGDHYKKLSITPFEIIDSCGLDFYEGNAIKYLLRKKGDTAKRIEDLEKCKDYINQIIRRLDCE